MTSSSRSLFCGLLWSLAACGGDASDTSKGGTTTPGTTDSGGEDAVIEPIYPTADQDRVLLYYGSGGFEPESSKGRFDDFDAHIKDAFGWNTDHRDAWTEDLSDYRMVGFVALGQSGEAPLDASQLSDLQTALANGTRLVFFGDRESCGATTTADTLAQLGASMGFTGTSADQNMRVDATELSDHQLTAGLSKVIFKEPCWVNSSGGNRVVNHVGNVVVAAQRPQTGGDIIVMGDFQVIDNSGYLDEESADNAAFAEQLVKVDPAL